jgi:hypothetical protein
VFKKHNGGLGLDGLRIGKRNGLFKSGNELSVSKKMQKIYSLAEKLLSSQNKPYSMHLVI